MFVQTLTILLPFALQASAAAYHRQSTFKASYSDDCPKGVHIVGVRGTLEKYPFGALQTVVDALKKKLPGSDSVGIDYPATGITIDKDDQPLFNFPEYKASEAKGYAKLFTEIHDFAERCPDTGIVVMGYSQGAQVVGDALCGSRGNILFDPKLPLDYSDVYSIRAIIQLGDPTNVRDLPWHQGNSTKRGIFPRQDFSPCGYMGDSWQSYCDDNDFFCDIGNSFEAHLHYVDTYLDKIVDFIVEKVKEPEESMFGCRVKSHDL